MNELKDPRMANIQQSFNYTRFNPGQQKGHYESFFQRANHPDRNLAFWIRYTIFSPHRQPEKAIGEIWAIWFDGENRQHTAVKLETDIKNCQFGKDRLFAKIENCLLEDGKLTGEASTGPDTISWDLQFTEGQSPLFNLPENLYQGSFPKAKVLVGHPLAYYTGKISLNGEEMDIQSWPGSQNHNWGEKHTDHYAWGQVAGFENSPESFLELATARLKFGPVWTPMMTPIVFRHEGREFKLNQLLTTFNRASFGYYYWNFKAENDQIKLQGEIKAHPDDFVCLNYFNPPGGTKYCLNSKIASCELEIQLKPSTDWVKLTSQNGAAFEILTDDSSHGLTKRV